MSAEKDFFDWHVRSLSAMTEIYKHVVSCRCLSSPLERMIDEGGDEHILRAEYSLIVSAFDAYMHKIVLKKLTYNFFSSSPSNKKASAMTLSEFHEVMVQTGFDYKKEKQAFEASLQNELKNGGILAEDAVNSALRWEEETFQPKRLLEKRNNFMQKWRKKLAQNSYQNAESVGDAMNLIDVKDVFQRVVEAAMSTPPAVVCHKIGNLTITFPNPSTSPNGRRSDQAKQLKIELNKIADKRNWIVHQAGMEYSKISLSESKLNVPLSDVDFCRELLTELVACIDYVVEHP